MINGNVYYIKISQFNSDTVDQFATKLSQAKDSGAAGLVIDLRNNSGGNMEAMAQILDLIVPSGDTVSYVDKSGKTTVEYSSKANETALPISVLVNENTYSAAELFAADIRDFNKGLLVGQTTAGSGMKTEIVPLSDGSAVMLPIARYITVNGSSFDGEGIAPDVDLSLSQEQADLLARNNLPLADDPQVQAAVTALVRQGAQVQEIPTANTSSSSDASSQAE